MTSQDGWVVSNLSHEGGASGSTRVMNSNCEGGTRVVGARQEVQAARQIGTERLKRRVTEVVSY